MGENKTRRGVLQLAGAGTLVGLAGCLSSNKGDEIPTGVADMRIRIENVAPTDFYPSDSSTGGELWFSPGGYVIQKGHARSIDEGSPASGGLEALAEAGLPTGFEGQQGLVDEMANVSGSRVSDTFGANATVEDPNDLAGTPAIAPGEAFEFDIRIASGRFLMFATKQIPSNDIFIASKDGASIKPWPWGGEPPLDTDLPHKLALWDAGTEPNQQPGFGSDQPPAQDSPDQGTDEGGVVRKLSDVDDGYDYPAVEDIVAVTLTPQ